MSGGGRATPPLEGGSGGWREGGWPVFVLGRVLDGGQPRTGPHVITSLLAILFVELCSLMVKRHENETLE